jgi:hypothetical protein
MKKVHYHVQKDPVTGPNSVYTIISNFFKIHFNIIIPSMPESPTQQTRILYAFLISPTHTIGPHPSHLPSFDHHINMYGEEYKFWKLISMQFSPASFYFFRLQPKYFPYVLSLTWKTKFHSCRKQKVQIIVLHILIVTFFDSRQKGKHSDLNRSKNFPNWICF